MPAKGLLPLFATQANTRLLGQIPGLKINGLYVGSHLE